MRVRKAVFPAAGWGTRLLPATKALPKEMLPLVDQPVIQYSIEEAVAAGIEQGVIVTSSLKRQIGDMVQMSFVRQKEQLGLGHAVLMAKEVIGHEPFAVMLPDDVVVGDRPC